MPENEQMTQEKASGPADVRELVAGINGGMIALMKIFDQSKGVVSDQDKAALAQIMQMFQTLVESMGSAQEGAPKQAQAPMGAAPVETRGQPARQAL